jgi:MFS superfamily sulfate permease-like transporter
MVLLFLTGPLSHMPDAVLSAVVFLIGIELIDVRGMCRIFAERPVEFWVALATTISVVFIGVEQGILLAMVLSLLAHTRHGYKAKNMVIEKKNGHFYGIPLDKAVQALPGLVAYRFNHSMYYANADQLSKEIRELAKLEPGPVVWFCIDMLAVDDVDFSAAAALRETCSELKGRQVRLVFSCANEHVRHELDISGVTELVGPDAFYLDLRTVLEVYQREFGTAETH